jgi:hypothetical protein
LALALAYGVPAAAQTEPGLGEIRRQIDILQQRRAEDAQRMRELEERLRRAEEAARLAVEQANRIAAQPDGPARAAAPQPATGQRAAATAATARSFNPGINVVLDGKLGYFQRDPSTYLLAGFQRADEGPGQRGVFLGEAEVNAFANVDDLFYGSLTAALAKDAGTTTIELEEAYIQTLALPWGFQATAGQVFSDIGYLNSFHAHADDFADRPLAYRAFLADQYGDPGIRLSWLAPTDVYVRLGAEVFRGDDFPSSAARDRGYGTKTAYLRVGGDIGQEVSYQTGFSWLTAHARERTVDTSPEVFGGSTDVAIAHLVMKWAPDGNPTQRNLKWQTELFRNRIDGDYQGLGPFDRTDYGLYSHLVYQFMPRWRIGYRYDWLNSGEIDRAVFLGTTLDDQGHEPSRHSAMVEYNHSEFSRLRLQYNYDRSRPDQIDHQVLLQYTATMGAHPAHPY